MPSHPESFYAQLSKSKSLPIGFFGSGFSQRYIGSPEWSSLIDIFAQKNGRTFNYYSGNVNDEIVNKLPDMARLIGRDLYENWHDLDEYRESREAFSQNVIDNADPLKYEIARYIDSLEYVDDYRMDVEREKLGKAQLHAVVTTNWDTIIERVFPDLKAYVGQDELIFANSFAIGEIYKIHGSIVDPRSLVLTATDYANFNKRNRYLVAKLLTMFVEHPIIFIGYSITDENIRGIFSQIMECLNQGQIEMLAQRIFFVNRVRPGRVVGLGQTSFNFGAQQLVVWQYVTDDLGEVFDALARIPDHYPVKFLRRLRTNIVSLTKSVDPNTMVTVVDFDSERDLDKVEVVIGVGMVEKLSDKGYIGYERIDLVNDMLANNHNHNRVTLLERALPRIVKGKKLVPIYYPLYLAGRLDQSGKLLERTDLDTTIERLADTELKRTSPLSRDQLTRKEQGFSELLADGYEAAIGYGAIVRFDVDDVVALRHFLMAHSSPSFPKGKDETHFWRLCCIYDRLVYGPEWVGDKGELHQALGIGRSVPDGEPER